MRLLDLFCGVGGAAMGYHRAGFEVTGIDNRPQKRYPFTFIQADALEYVAEHGAEYDVIHASPPCQAYSHITPDKNKHPDLIAPTRELLKLAGKPYVIENVPGARKLLDHPIMLCGTQFGLKVYRHRFFETQPMLLFQPWHVPHHDKTPRAGHGISPKGFLSVTSGGQGIKSEQVVRLLELACDAGVSPYQAAQLVKLQSSDSPVAQATHRFVSPKGFISVCGHFSQVDYARYAMGIEWATQYELSQAIPPAYTEWIGRQILQMLTPQ